MSLFPDSWPAVIAFEAPLIELMARGSILYLTILALFRLLPRRTGNELTATDLVLVLIIAEAASHALGEYQSVGDGLVVVLTLMFWNYLLNYLSYRFRFFERLTTAPPLEIIRDGKLLRRNMKRELLTLDEIMEGLRKQGIENLSQVKLARVETEGEITVIKKNSITGSR